jgi:hypothetical protein
MMKYYLDNQVEHALLKPVHYEEFITLMVTRKNI